MHDPIDDVTEDEELLIFHAYLDEQNKLQSSFAINHTLKENGLMQSLNVETGSQAAELASISANQMLETNDISTNDGDGWFEGQDMLDILAQPTPELQAAKVQEIRTSRQADAELNVMTDAQCAEFAGLSANQLILTSKDIISSDAVYNPIPKDTIYDTEGASLKPLDIIGSTNEKQFSGGSLAEAFLEAKAKLGGDDVVKESLEDVVAATATNSTIKPLTKKQLKAQKHMQKNMQSYMKKAQKQAQTQHILNKLYTHSIRTPEQARQIHAAQLAKAEVVSILGQRQADAFFAAKPGTKCHDFFPKATVAANPTLMTSAQGESRTLEQVYEYFIYKHFMILTKKAETPFEGELNTSVDWENTEVKPYVVYEGADEATKLDQTAQGDIVEEAQTETTESSYLEEEDQAA
jgi:hypothetical protein